MGTGRTLHVRCATWEQVDVFHTRKLRRGKLLSMKVPFQTEIGAEVTLGLELPNQVVVAIEGVVQNASPIDGDTKTWIEVELTGFTEDVLARIRVMAATAAMAAVPATRKPAPAAAQRRATTAHQEEELPADERQLFQQLTAELRRMRGLAVHDVLGVGRAADADEVRRGWMELVRQHHPDLVARHRAPAITHLAEELTILCNRAYDRLRAAMVAEGRATVVGSVLRSPPGWLVGFEDIASVDAAAVRAALVEPASVSGRHRADTPPPPTAHGGDAFELRARAMLGDGDSNNAQEVLAAALCVYPRSRALRSLYYVASAIGALEKGEVMLATSQLETALAHNEQCSDAVVLLEHIRKHGDSNPDQVRSLFR
ncbi:MAG: heat shock protein DnaJ domain protein [Deltaproteobacteria bacterium]|nr:heat shock protein DnaJ domain protein [Deltaproteobacteria bacterium]